jgi:hypothetical protein
MSNGQQPTRPRVPMVPGPRGTHAAPAEQQATAPFVTATGGTAGLVAAVPPLVRVQGPTGKVAKAIANCMREVGTIKKRGHNEFFNYKYATFDDLLYAITPLMGEHGLAVTQNEVEMKQEKQHLTVKYEFIVYHESGESLPPQMFTGMSLLMTRKGTYDDKAINKAHSAARKYFLLSLFQVPAGDFDDADEAPDANQRRVPGPAREQKSAPAERKPAPQPKTEPKAEETKPHKIVLGPGHGPDEWAGAYIRAIGKAQTEEEITQWDVENDPILQMLSDRYSAVYEQIAAAVERRLTDIGAPSKAMPDPKKDPTEAMNWVASQLQQLSTLEAAEAFWNQMVAPHESSFEVIDWEMLMQEWQRTEDRLKPPPEAA